MYIEAAKTAVIIAQEQQNKGFYKAAHDLLFGKTYKFLFLLKFDNLNNKIFLRNV